MCKLRVCFSFVFMALTLIQLFAQPYKNFRVAVYCRAYEVDKMKDPHWLETVWNELSNQVHVDKIYL